MTYEDIRMDADKWYSQEVTGELCLRLGAVLHNFGLKTETWLPIYLSHISQGQWLPEECKDIRPDSLAWLFEFDDGTTGLIAVFEQFPDGTFKAHALGGQDLFWTVLALEAIELEESE